MIVGNCNCNCFLNVKKILKLGKTRLPLKFSQEIRTEKRISHFNLKGDLVGKIYVWGDILRGGGGYVPDYTCEVGCVPHYTT